MAVDLTQFIEGDDIVATLRGSVRPGADGRLGLQIEPDHGGHVIPLDQLIRAEHVAPQIVPGRYYIAGRSLYVGSTGGVVYGPIMPGVNPQRLTPTEVVMIRGLRPAEVRPVVPA